MKTAVCRMCHEEIIFIGPYWDHTGENKPRHPALPFEECQSCQKPFSPNLDSCLCDDCVNEAYSHKPELYARIALVDGSSFVVPLSEVGQALKNEFSGDAEVGMSWTVTLITMSKAEYEVLPEFAGH